MEPYRKLYPDAGKRLPHTKSIADRLMVLPTGPAVDDAATFAVCGLIAFVVKQGGSLGARMTASPSV